MRGQTLIKWCEMCSQTSPIYVQKRYVGTKIHKPVNTAREKLFKVCGSDPFLGRWCFWCGRGSTQNPAEVLINRGICHFFGWKISEILITTILSFSEHIFLSSTRADASFHSCVQKNWKRNRRGMWSRSRTWKHVRRWKLSKKAAQCQYDLPN